jgi:hypothetical protein
MKRTKTFRCRVRGIGFLGVGAFSRLVRLQTTASPSLVAEIGAIIEHHPTGVGMMKPWPDPHLQTRLDAKLERLGAAFLDPPSRPSPCPELRWSAHGSASTR